MKYASVVLLATNLALGATACARPPDDSTDRSTAATPAATEPVRAATTAAAADTPLASTPVSTAAGALPVVVVHKSPTCSCCGLWVDHLRAAGFEVQVNDSDDLASIKRSVGIPAEKASCHTAQVGGYFVEGHVPAEDIKRLLADRPDAKGLVLPGMPAGSPGMETPDGSRQPYTVELVRNDGSTLEFSRH